MVKLLVGTCYITLVYLNVILIYCKNAEKYAKHLPQIFEALRQLALYINPKKCIDHIK